MELSMSEKCKAFKKNGEPCSRTAVSNDFCSQHYKMYKNDVQCLENDNLNSDENIDVTPKEKKYVFSGINSVAFWVESIFCIMVFFGTILILAYALTIDKNSLKLIKELFIYPPPGSIYDQVLFYGTLKKFHIAIFGFIYIFMPGYWILQILPARLNNDIDEIEIKSIRYLSLSGLILITTTPPDLASICISIFLMAVILFAIYPYISTRMKKYV